MNRIIQALIIIPTIIIFVFSCKAPIDYEDRKVVEKKFLDDFLLDTDDGFDISSEDFINGIYIKDVEEVMEEENTEGEESEDEETTDEESTDNTTTVDEERPEIDKKIEIQYIGRVINGKDNPIFEQAEIMYVHGSGYVIKGLNIAVSLMAEGDSAIIVVPTDLGYGSSQSKVPVYSNLLYELKLLNVE